MFTSPANDAHMSRQWALCVQIISCATYKHSLTYFLRTVRTVRTLRGRGGIRTRKILGDLAFLRRLPAPIGEPFLAGFKKVRGRWDSNPRGREAHGFKGGL